MKYSSRLFLQLSFKLSKSYAKNLLYKKLVILEKKRLRMYTFDAMIYEGTKNLLRRFLVGAS